jgi:carboxylesterase
MRPLQASLEALGVVVSLPLMRGHGASSPQALQGVTWAGWLADGSAALEELATRVDRVILIGHSMGALVALQLAADHGDCGDQLDSLVLLATPLQLASPLAPGLAPAPAGPAAAPLAAAQGLHRPPAGR